MVVDLVTLASFVAPRAVFPIICLYSAYAAIHRIDGFLVKSSWIRDELPAIRKQNRPAGQ